MKSFLWRIALQLFQQYAKKRLFSVAKRQGVIIYLRVLKVTRLLLLAAMASFLFLQVMVMGFFGSLVTGFYLWDHDPRAKMEILFGIFLGMFVLPALLLIVGFSERFWYKASGAQKLVEEVAAQSDDAA